MAANLFWSPFTLVLVSFCITLTVAGCSRNTADCKYASVVYPFTICFAIMLYYEEPDTGMEEFLQVLN